MNQLRFLRSAGLSCVGAYFLLAAPAQAQIDLGGMIQSKVEERVQHAAEKAVDNALDSTQNNNAQSTSQSNGSANASANASSNGSANATASASGSSASAQAPANLKAYANYDFMPGSKILFEDNFIGDQDGEFPSHWELKAGQAIVNAVDGAPAFLLTDGNYAMTEPRMKTKSYLPSAFTIEFDMRPAPQTYGMVLRFHDPENTTYDQYFAPDGSVKASGKETELDANYPGDKDNYLNQWHHCAIAFKNQQMKFYVDQYRVLVMPSTHVDFQSVEFGGIGDQTNPVVFRNVRIADGAGMNMLDKLTTDGRIVTHGILFDVGKSAIKPESMGTLNGIAKLMQNDASIKFEIGGYTDNDGSAAANQKLSQDRAEAVRKALTDMGIAGGRLTSKGYGQAKPIDNNSTPEGKANNRRVEFVKI